MATITRKNAWDNINHGTFNNPDLLWYAKGVKEMQSRNLDDPTSWWFFAAMHGQYLINGPVGFPNWANIPGVPKVPTTPIPSNTLVEQYWNQCQHGGWFFLPWHRGYLYALENVLRDIILGLGGPADWALPYWNYFVPGNQYLIPPAFTQQSLPDGTSNPLFVTARYGPVGNGSIFVKIPPLTQDCQKEPNFIKYGGGKNGFVHFDSKTGKLEDNPHNKVHSQIGGNSTTSNYYGLMADAGLAALDPIFYLHHCNIDRMWAAWNNARNANPLDPDWLNGPTARAERKFYMPKPDKTPWNYTPQMVNTTIQLNYTYDDLSLGIQLPRLDPNTLRLRNLALGLERFGNFKFIMDNNTNKELIGANRNALKLSPSGAHTKVLLDSSGWQTVSKSINNVFAARTEEGPEFSNMPDEVYLELEGVKGTAESNMYTVSVNHHYAGDISLFGLRMASTKEGQHGGAGLTIRLDITKIIDKLHLNDNFDLNSLDVLIQPSGPISKDAECTIDRVSIYRIGSE